jgi:hypothetical protein
MKGTLTIAFLFMILLAGCQSTGKTKNLGHEGGEPYADVAVPVNYEAYDTPPFKRQDGAGDRRIYGRYAYKSKDGLDSATEVAGWYKEALPKDGWEFQTEELDEAKGTMSLRFKKADDQLLLKLAPDERTSGSERFSVLIVEMNPQYD